MVEIKKIKENLWKIPKSGKMNVPAYVFASKKLMQDIKQDLTFFQLKNMASMPGVITKVIALGDAHQGYGACIGGVMAFDTEKGVVSPGAIGYDINCGVHVLTTNLKKDEFLPKRKDIIHQIRRDVPAGVGRGTKYKLTEKDLDEILNTGLKWAIKNKLATKSDMEKTEENGSIQIADASKISQKAKSRGRNQLGTLGSGNHFIDIHVVDEIYDKETAKTFGITQEGQILVTIHCGSRGLGHQVASDYIRAMEKQYGYEHLPDRELASAPINSKLGQDYLAAMSAAANFGFTNRQVIGHHVIEAIKKQFPEAKLSLLYDIAHNMAKFEKHKINGKMKEVCIHRKGATRSFGPSRSSDYTKKYAKTGCPIFIPGSMGTASYVLAGTDKALELSFGSTAHGAGRHMSRTEAKKTFTPEQIKAEMKEKDIYLESTSMKGTLEEASGAYKDVDEVVRVSHELGIGRMIAKLMPIAVING